MENLEYKIIELEEEIQELKKEIIDLKNDLLIIKERISVEYYDIPLCDGGGITINGTDIS
jgi:predicted  nucleic acid-binding Zn-ribbon protein